MPPASPPSPPSNSESRDRSSAARFAGIGLQLAVTILISLAIGNWLDKRFKTGLFIYLAVFIGAAAAFYSMYRQLMANLEREEAKRSAKRNAGGSA